jgi:hypothetical protein
MVIKPEHVLAALVACGDTAKPPAPAMTARPPAPPVPPARQSAPVLDGVISGR